MEEILELRPRDGPAHALMAVMGEWNWQAPADWPGYRALTEK
jgi:hypothetical protein